MAGALTDLAERTLLFRQPLSVSLRRFVGLPRSAIGTAIAHFGIGICLLGVAAEANYGAERILAMKPGQTVVAARLRSHLQRSALRATVRIIASCSLNSPSSRDGETIGTLEPSKRTFPARNSATTEAALLTRGVSQLYLSLGDVGTDGSIAVGSITSRWCC